MALQNDHFELYDLRVELVRCEGTMVTNQKIGDYFEVKGENLIFGPDSHFSIYALSALLPLLPAKQRETAPADWMTTDCEIRIPDPACGAIYKISRTGKRTFKNSETSGLNQNFSLPEKF